MAEEIRAIQYGVGPIGGLIVRVALERGIRFVGAIDIDRDKVGRDLGEVIGLGRELGTIVSDDAEAVLSRTEADIVLHSTCSYLKDAASQLEGIIKTGLPLISTCEELGYPKARCQKEELTYPNPANAGLVERLDDLASAQGVAFLGTGVNPGFVMDRLPAVLSEICHAPRKITVIRVVDAALRRLPLQRKIGVGLTVKEFEQMAGKEVRHVGLRESVTAIADFLAWRLDDITPETIAPIVAEKPLRTQFFEVPPGRVAGMRQTMHGVMGDEKVITMDLRMSVGAPDLRDVVRIEATPLEGYPIPLGPIENQSTGVHGDIATAAITVNSIRRVLAARPGLLTMLDIPPAIR